MATDPNGNVLFELRVSSDYPTKLPTGLTSLEELRWMFPSGLAGGPSLEGIRRVEIGRRRKALRVIRGGKTAA